MADDKARKPANDEVKKTDPAATREDSPRPAPRWKHPDPKDDVEDELFNDMPV